MKIVVEFNIDEDMSIENRKTLADFLLDESKTVSFGFETNERDVMMDDAEPNDRVFMLTKEKEDS